MKLGLVFVMIQLKGRRGAQGSLVACLDRYKMASVGCQRRVRFRESKRLYVEKMKAQVEAESKNQKLQKKK